MQKVVHPIGEILKLGGKNQRQYESLYKNNSLDLDAHGVRERTKNYLMELIKRRQLSGYNKDNPNYYAMRNSTSNYATEIYRLDSLSFRGLGANNEESYFQFPNWANQNRWGKIKQTFGIDSEPIDKVESRFNFSVAFRPIFSQFSVSFQSIFSQFSANFQSIFLTIFDNF